MALHQTRCAYIKGYNLYISAQRIMIYIACSRQIGTGDLISDLLSMVAALSSLPTYIGKT
jgi:hypothetical protein